MRDGSAIQPSYAMAARVVASIPAFMGLALLGVVLFTSDTTGVFGRPSWMSGQVLVARRITGGTEHELSCRIRHLADHWRRRAIWKRYAPLLFPLKPSRDGSVHARIVLRFIEGEPEHVKTLPRAERIAFRKERARKLWADFYASLGEERDCSDFLRSLK